jgi:hypothetical protein
MTRLTALLLAALVIVGCGDPRPKGSVILSPEAEAEYRAHVMQILRRAVIDSTLLATTPFEMKGVMTTELRQEEERVVVEDRFGLVGRGIRGGPVTLPESHTVTGDTTLLKDMYTFEDPKGNIRKQESQELAGLAFGSDFSTILRQWLDSTSSATLRPGDVMYPIDGVSCYLFYFTSDAGEGAFFITSDSLDLRRLEVKRESDYLIGRYSYNLTADFRRTAAGVLLPIKMITRFDYRRFLTEGTGSIVVELRNN